MGRIDPAHIIGIHVNALVTIPSMGQILAGLVFFTRAERRRLARFRHFRDDMMGYMQIQGTRPKTLAYGLTDSPAGHLAWIVEKFKEWTDPAAERPENAIDRDRILTNVSVNWFTRAAGSSANLYYETLYEPDAGKRKAQPGSDRGGGLVDTRCHDPTLGSAREQRRVLVRVRARRPLRRPGGPGVPGR